MRLQNVKIDLQTILSWLSDAFSRSSSIVQFLSLPFLHRSSAELFCSHPFEGSSVVEG